MGRQSSWWPRLSNPIAFLNNCRISLAQRGSLENDSSVNRQSALNYLILLREILVIHFYDFAAFIDPYVLRMMEKAGPFARRMHTALQPLWIRLLSAGRIVLKVVAIPFRLARKLVQVVLGNFQIRYSPSAWLQAAKAAFDRARLWVTSSIFRVREAIARSKMQDPVLFRGTVASLAMLAFLMGSCSTFQLYQQLTRVNVSISNPEYRPPVETQMPAGITVVFSKPAIAIDLIGKSVPLKISPPISGTWTFTSDTTIQFQPVTHWPPDTEFTVELDPKFFRPGMDIPASARFDSPEFKGSLTSSEFYVDPHDANVKKAVVVLEFTYPVDAESLQKHISLTYRAGLFSGDAVEHNVTVDPSGMMAYIHSGNMPIQDESVTLEFKASSGIEGKEGGKTDDSLTSRITIPGRYARFHLNQANVQLVRNEAYELDQILFVEASSGVSPDELTRNLTVYELPADRPASPGTEAQKDYPWQNIEEIDRNILSRSKRIQPELIPAQDDADRLHSFKIQAREGSRLFVTVKKNTKDRGDFLLKEDFQTIVGVPQFRREVRIMHDGAILSLAGEKKLSILSYDNDVLEVEVARIMPDQINHLVSQSYGNFRSPFFRNYSFNEENIGKKYVERIQLNRQPGQRLQYASVDFSKYVNAASNRMDNGLFVIKIKGLQKSELNRPKPKSQGFTGSEEEPSESSGYSEGYDGEGGESSEYYESSEYGDESPTYTAGKTEDRRFVLVSDLGIVVKAERGGSRDVFIQSFSKEAPVGGVQVQVLGKNGIPLLTRDTDANGRVEIPSLAEFAHEQSPVAITARVGNDLSFLPFDREDRTLDYSRFDVGGLHGADEKNRLNAFIFSDRGIFRPGDEIRGAFIIKAGDWRRSLGGLPVELSIRDSRGMAVHSRIIKLSASAFEEFSFKTEETSPTGTYEVRLALVKAENQPEIMLGTTNLRVEEFVPDNLRITAQFSEAETAGWMKPAGMKGQVLLMNLFGTPAQRKIVKGTIILTPRFPSFAGYSEYRFYDPLRTERTFRQELGTLETDDEGRVEFPLQLDRFAKGIYAVTFYAEGFEADGGRSVAAQQTAIISPLDKIIGIKSEGNTSYIKRGSEQAISLIALDSRLNRAAATGLTIRIIEARHVSSLVKRYDGIYEYRSTIKEIPVSKAALSIPATGIALPLPTTNAGDFILSIVDGDGQELNRLEFSVVGDSNIARSLERNAELSLHLNGKDFAAGEEIEVSIRAPYAGAGLITIEKDRVYAHKWFRTTTESSIQRIRVPEGLEGNGYVNVTFVRGMNSKSIYTSPLSYGVAPFSVSRRHRTAHLQIAAPAEIRPGSSLNVSYDVGAPGRLVVYAVDEGILQVARYGTPDPLAHFFQRRALEVSTSQIVDQLLPEFSIVQSLMKTGGDSDVALGLNLNPFKRRRQMPVAYWSGLRDVSGAGVVSFNIPDYFNGRVRVMAVFVRDNSMAVAEKSTVVRGDFILSPSLPAFAAPGDEMEFSVNVANNVRGSGKDLPVQLVARAEGSLSLATEGQPIALSISEKGEAVAHIKVKALKPGEGRIVLTASGGGRSTVRTESMSIRPARPYITDVVSGMLIGGSDEITITRDLYPDFRKMQVTLSPVPLSWSSGFYSYLDSYPYGCTEQLTSRGLASLILKGSPLPGDRDRMQKSVDLAMAVLRTRQNDEGAFGFWAANSYVDPLQTTYGMLFLTEAKERGQSVPDTTYRNGMQYLLTMIRRSEASLHDRAFALYVLTRNGAIHVNELNTLISELSTFEKKDADRARLAAMYLAATRKLMHQDKEADELFDRSQPVFLKKWLMAGYDPVAANAAYLYLLSRHFPQKFSVLGDKTMTSMMKDLRQGQFSTISAATSVLAIDSYIAMREKTGLTTDMSVIQENADGSRRPLPFAKQLFSEASLTPGAKKLRFEAKSALPSFYQFTLAGFDKTLPAPYQKGIEVSREFTDASGSTVKQVKIGDEVYVHLRIRAIDGAIGNVAIVDLLPAGMEPISLQSDSIIPVDDAGLFKPAAMKPDHVEMREDRVIVFTGAQSKATEFVYRMKAVASGTFIVPPLFAEAMYDRNVRALTAEDRFTVQTRK